MVHTHPFLSDAVFKASQVLWAAFFFIWKEGSGALRLQVGLTVWGMSHASDCC